MSDDAARVLHDLGIATRFSDPLVLSPETRLLVGVEGAFTVLDAIALYGAVKFLRAVVCKLPEHLDAHKRELAWTASATDRLAEAAARNPERDIRELGAELVEMRQEELASAQVG